MVGCAYFFLEKHVFVKHPIAHAQKISNPINILRKHFWLTVQKYVMEILMYCHLLKQPDYRCHRHETIGTWAETENWFDDRCLLFIDHHHPFKVGLGMPHHHHHHQNLHYT